MGFLDLADKILGELQADLKLAEGRVLDSHRVGRVIWETNNAVIFRDEAGCFWRYLHAYRQAWPVIIGGMQAATEVWKPEDSDMDPAKIIQPGAAQSKNRENELDKR